MFAGSMVDYKINDYTNAAFMTLIEKLFKIRQSTVIGVYRLIVDDIIAVVGGRRHDRHQPDTADAQVTCCFRVSIIKIVEL